MNILALETSSASCSVALLYENTIMEKFAEGLRQQAQVLLPFVDELLSQAGITLQQLDAITLSNGPGSFVGLRLGAGVAQGLAFGANLPIVPVSSLAVIAQTAYREQQFERVLVALNAYMGEIYYGVYELNSAGIMQASQPDSLCQPEAIEHVGNNYTAIGSGWSAYPVLLEQLNKSNIKLDDSLQPHAQDVITLARPLLNQGKVMSAVTLSPFYLRSKAAWQ